MPSVNVAVNSPHFKLVTDDRPVFEVVKSIPTGITPQLEAAVKDFMHASHLPQGVDANGFYYQTLQAMAQASYLGGGGELWLGTMNGDLVIYLLAHVGNDYDGRLAYTVTQAWVREDQRGKKWVKDAWEEVRHRAKDCMCKHFAVISSLERTAAYCRFLGKGFHKYAEILKEEF